MKKFNLFLIFLLCCIIFNVNAQWNQLTDSNLQGGEAEGSFVMTVDSSLLMATEGGVFKSTNKGASWNYSSNGLDSLSNQVRRITKFNSNIYLMDNFSNLYITLDNGNSWTKMTENGIPPYSWTMSLGSANNLLFKIIGIGSDTAMIYYSSNGTDWSQGAYLGNTNTQNKLLHLSNDSMYIYKNDSLFYTVDGTTVTPVSFNGLGATTLSNYDYLAGEPNENYLYYNTGDSIFRYNTNLQLWENITNGFGTFMMIDGLKAVDNTLFVTTIDMSFNVKLYRSTDHGNIWAEIPSPGMDMNMVNTIIKVGLNDLVCINIWENIYYSDNNGSTWTIGNTGFFERDNSGLKAINNTLLTLKGDYGIIRSTDNGLNWNFSNTGLPAFLTNYYFIRESFKVKDTVYITVNENPFSDSFFLYNSIDMGATWNKVTNAPDSVECSFAGKNDTTLFMKFGSCYLKTLDGGASWTDISSGLSTLNISKVYGFLGKGDSLLLFAKKTNNDEAIFLSTDNGDIWTDLSNGAVGPNMEFKVLNRWEDVIYPKPVMNFGGTENRPVIVISDHSWPHIDNLYMFNGTTWLLINTTGLPSTLDVQDIVYYNGYWYISDKKGVFRSDDCINWLPVQNNTNLYMGMQGTSIQFINDNIFLGTRANSSWTADLTAGLDNTELISNINIYPNPCNSDFTIELNANNTNSAVIEIFNLSGQKMFEKTYSDINKGNNKINVKSNNMPVGIYLIKINNGTEQYTHKLVITK